MLAKFANFVHFCITLTTKWPKFTVLQYFATKLGRFTNFNMLFRASVKDFDFFAKMKIQFKRGMVHSYLTGGVQIFLRGCIGYQRGYLGSDLLKTPCIDRFRS